MIKFFSEIVGTPILDYENGALLGLIKDVIIDPDTGKIEAFWVKPATVPISDGVIQVKSILEWKKNVYIKGDREIADPADIIRVTEILAKNTLFIDNNVQNESEEKLGKVYDLDFDTTSFYINNIYAQKGFFVFKYQPRTFSYGSILKTLPDYILVKDIEPVEEKSVLAKGKQPILDV